MQITDLGQLPTYLAQPNLPFDFVELPGGNFTANRSDGTCFAIARNTPHVAAVWTFAKFLAGPGGTGAALLAERQPMVPALRALQTAPNWLSSALPDHHTAAFLPKPAMRFPLVIRRTRPDNLVGPPLSMKNYPNSGVAKHWQKQWWRRWPKKPRSFSIIYSRLPPQTRQNR